MLLLMSDSIGNEIREFRKGRIWTQTDLGRALGVTPQFISKLEKDLIGVPKEILNKLVSLGFRHTTEATQKGSEPRSLIAGKMKKVRVIGNAEAGSGVSSVDAEDEGIWVPSTLASHDNMGFKIEGLSMAPVLLPGDVAVFKPSSTPRSGYTYLLKTADGEFRCKNIEYKRGEWVLVSLNDNYPDEPIGDAQVVGLLVGYYHVHGLHERLESLPDGLRLEKLQ